MRFDGDEVDSSPNAAWVPLYDGEVNLDYPPIQIDEDSQVDDAFIIWDLERIRNTSFQRDAPFLGKSEKLGSLHH